MLGRPSAPPAPPPLCISKSPVSPTYSRVGVRLGKWEVGSPRCSLAPARPRLSLSPFYPCVGGCLTCAPSPARESSHLPWPPPSPSPPRLWPAASLPSCASRGLLMHARFFAWSLGRRERHHLHQPDCPPCPHECDHCGADTPSVPTPVPKTNQPPFLL